MKEYYLIISLDKFIYGSDEDNSKLPVEQRAQSCREYLLEYVLEYVKREPFLQQFPIDMVHIDLVKFHS